MSEIRNLIENVNNQLQQVVSPTFMPITARTTFYTYSKNMISATVVRTIPENDLRYCFVYFTNLKNAKAVENKFDNFNMFGNRLIVLRKSQLLEQIE